MIIVASLGSFHSPYSNGCLEFSNCLLVVLKYHTVMSLFLLRRIVEWFQLEETFKII